jgi:hypothetical protein
MSPALKAAQLREDLSFGNEINVLTSGSFSIKITKSQNDMNSQNELTFARIVITSFQFVCFLIEQILPQRTSDKHECV